MENADAPVSSIPEVNAALSGAGAPMVRITTAGGSLNSRLENLIAGALDIFRREAAPPVVDRGLMRQLDELAQKVKQGGRVADAQRIHHHLNELKAFFNLADPDDPGSNPGQVRLFTSPDKCRAFIAVMPPRGDGNPPVLSAVSGLLAKVGIVQGVDLKVVEKTLEMVRAEGDIAWGVMIARGIMPVSEQAGHVNFRVTVIDKDLFRRDLATMQSVLGNLGKPVEEEEVIGISSNFQGSVQGVDVFGHPVNASPGSRTMELSDDIQRSPEGLLKAKAAGYVVRSGARLELMPFYVLAAAGGTPTEDISFPGAVLVQGDFTGSVALECEDLFVLGNCEQVRVQARGDIFIAGGAVGHHQTSLEADGDVYASFISETTVSALGDIVCGNAIVNSRLVSSGSIRVTSAKGMIAGGNLAALKSITAATIGSEFGMFTETAVGRDFLTAARLEEIVRRISMHTENLRRIQDLKQQIVRWRASLENMPPDKQEILLNVLRKERNSQMEMKSLVRRRARLQRVIGDFLSASVQVIDNIYPPTRVKICDAICDIREKLNAVTLRFDERRGVIEEAN